MTNSYSKSATRRSFLKYLSELKSLVDEEFKEERLLPLEETNQAREQSKATLPEEKTIFTINFAERHSQAFQDYVKALNQSNPSSVYVWLEKSNVHGVYKVNSLDSINFSFPFDIDPNGIIAFMTSDLNDRLLLDFYYDENDHKMLEIEVQGKNWAEVTLPIVIADLVVRSPVL